MPRLQSKSILVVDDEEDIRDLLIGELSIYGYYVESAENGKQAIELMAKKNFDLILSDIRMPVMDGVLMLDELQKFKHKMPLILMMSAYTDQSEMEIKARGAAALISKPFRLKQLITKIDELFRAQAREQSRKLAA